MTDRTGRNVKVATGDQGMLFGRPTMPRPARRRQPPKQTTVTIGADAIAAVVAGRTTVERVIAEAVRAARPEVRNVAVDLGSIRWTDPKAGRRIVFDTPASVRDMMLLTAPEPFRFILGRAARVTRF